MAAAMTVVEMARVDASCSTFLMVHNSLCMLTIGLLGSEQQKQELLPSLASLEHIGELWHFLFNNYSRNGIPVADGMHHMQLLKT